MKIVRFDSLGTIKYGLLEENVVHGLQGSPFEHVQEPWACLPLDGTSHKLGDVKLLAPCQPSKYVGFGLNFRKTAETLNMPIPEIPVMFLKPPTSVVGPDDPIILPSESSKVIHEGELMLVIGKLARNVPEETARDYIFGFTCTNDVSDLAAFEQDRGNPTRTKGRDTFGPIGPWIETSLEPDNLKIEVMVNGQLRQSGSTSDFIFSINKMVSFASSVMTLLPGDVLATGTPPGSAPLKLGDVIEINIENIGTLKNSVIADH